MARVRTHSHLVDQFGEPLEGGRWYGIRLHTEPPTRAVPRNCEFLLRERAFFRREDGSTLVISQLSAASYCFVLLDDEKREITRIPDAIKDRELKSVANTLQIIKSQAFRRRRRLQDLSDELSTLLAGVAPADDLAAAIASFIRDDDSHVTVESLLEWYSNHLDQELRGGQS
jgi:hypothetical protein